MAKKWTYSRSLTYKDTEGNVHTALSQLYSIGVYVIIDDNPRLQYSVTPAQMVKIEKSIKKDFEKGLITDLVLGVPITVIRDENGFYVEVNKIEK
jgi:hypothetical protein